MPRTNKSLLIGLLIGIFGVAFQAFGVLTAMNPAVSELRANNLYAWAFSTFSIGMVMAVVIAGRLTDKLGPSRPLVTGFIFFTVGLAGAAFAPHIAVLLVSRFLQGLGSGAMNLSVFVLVAQLFNERERARLMVILAFLWVLPAFLGPPVAGWISSHWGWRWVFGVTFIPIAICALMALRPLLLLERVVPDAQPEPVPIWAGVVLGLAVAALQVASQLIAKGAIRPVPIVLGVLGIAGLAKVIPIIMPVGFFTASPGLPCVIWVRALQSGTFLAAEPFLQLLLTQNHGLRAQDAGLFITVGSIGWTAGSALQSQSWFKLRRDQIITLGAISSTIGLAVVAGFSWFSDLWFVVPGIGWTLTGFGMGLSQASTSLAVMGLSEAHKQGRNTSSLQVAEGLGTSVLTGMAGAIMAFFDEGLAARTLTPGSNYLVVFGFMSVLCLLAIWLSRRIGTIPNAVAGK